MPTYAIDLDSPIMQNVVMRYVTTMGEGLARLAAAIERGNAGRHDAIDEATCLQALAHVLSHRLGERMPDEGPGEGDASEEE